MLPDKSQELPHDQRLSNVLDQWRLWPMACDGPPAIIAEIGPRKEDGSGNHSYLLDAYLPDTGKTRFVLRLAGQCSPYAVDPRAEQQLQNQLAQRSIAPAVLFQSDEPSPPEDSE